MKAYTGPLLGIERGCMAEFEPAPRYRTFVRSCTGWESFARARKVTRERGLTFEQARERCAEFERNRTARQIRKGTRLEFTREN